jgi:pimeloyl-ACP methyl ester carboxylesterase
METTAGLREGGVTVAGLRSQYLEAGPSGATEAAVFVNGNPGSPRDWVDLLARIGGLGRAVAPGMPGVEHTALGHARHLSMVLQVLGIRRAHLVLDDFGGVWGLRWACEYPEALASVTLIGAGVVVVDDFDGGDRRVTGVVKLRCEQAETLRSLKRPVLVLWGARDPYLPVRYAERQREVFPGARIVVLEESGRRPFADDPESVADEVLLFLGRNLAASQRPERRSARET